MQKIPLRQLDCYKNATEEEKNWKYINPDQAFDLTRIPSDTMRKEVAAYLFCRGRELTLKSMRTEFPKYNAWSQYVSDSGLSGSLSGFDPETEIRNYRKWLMAHGYRVLEASKRRPGSVSESVYLRFYRRLLTFYEPEDTRPEIEKDIWQIKNLDGELRQNPSHMVTSLSFREIPQQPMREEMKQAAAFLIRTQALLSVHAELSAVKRFTRYLQDEYPHITSFAQLNRDILESYLIRIRTTSQKKSCHSDLSYLKTVLEMIGKVSGYANLENLMLREDIPKAAKTLYRAYSDAEIRRLNQAILTGDAQTARIWMLQGLLGTRISEILALKTDCITGKNTIRIQQSKTQRSYEKTVTPNVIKLIQKAIDETKSVYGETEYIFVSKKNPGLPLSYAGFFGRIRKIIKEHGLQDDNGRPFTVGTHILRHTYGKHLAEQGNDDIIIAKQLGHHSIQSVQYYRQLGDDYMSEATNAHRSRKDAILTDILKGWQS